MNLEEIRLCTYTQGGTYPYDKTYYQAYVLLKIWFNESGKIVDREYYDPFSNPEPDTSLEELKQYISDRYLALQKPIIDLDDQNLFESKL